MVYDSCGILLTENCHRWGQAPFFYYFLLFSFIFTTFTFLFQGESLSVYYPMSIIHYEFFTYTLIFRNFIAIFRGSLSLMYPLSIYLNNRDQFIWVYQDQIYPCFTIFEYRDTYLAFSLLQTDFAATILVSLLTEYRKQGYTYRQL